MLIGKPDIETNVKTGLVPVFAPDKNISTCSESENKEPEESAVLCVSKSKIASDRDSSDSVSEDNECRE